MIEIQCVAECDYCHKREKAFIRQGLSSGFGDGPVQELMPTSGTPWFRGGGGMGDKVLCSVACQEAYSQRQLIAANPPKPGSAT